MPKHGLFCAQYKANNPWQKGAVSEALDPRPLLGRCAAGAARCQDDRAKSSGFISYASLCIVFITSLILSFIELSEESCIELSNRISPGAYVHPFTSQITGCIFQQIHKHSAAIGHHENGGRTCTSEETRPNGTIMAYLSHKSHSCLSFAFTSQGIFYSRNVQKCKMSFKNKWA